MNIVELIEATTDDSAWNWDFCCVCGEKPTDFGLYLTGTTSEEGPDQLSTVVRIAWCADKTCVEDRLGSPYMPIPEEVVAA